MQPTSLDIWQEKYQARDWDGNPIDQNPCDSLSRVASALAAQEADTAKWVREFMWAMEYGALPAGRIMANAGAQEFKHSTSLINCTVSRNIHDSLTGIMQALAEAAITLKAGCGIGYCFSTLRPKGAFVQGVGATTNGPIPYMDVFDKMCFTVSSAGGRRGAQMGTMHVWHPDIIDFIKAKRQPGRMEQFNLSVLVTDDFLTAVKHDMPWRLVFPAHQREAEKLSDDEIYWMPWIGNADEYVSDKNGWVLCKVYKTMPARDLWKIITDSTYEYSEPGVIFIDACNRMNNLWWCEHITASNPCGEQLLPGHGACLLGSINLTKLVKHPFSKNASFDWATYKKVVRIFTRMLDNVVEIAGLPLPEQTHELMRKRRHGMGFLGLASTLAMLGIRYDSKQGRSMAERIIREMAISGYQEGVRLAKEKGMAPILDETFEVTQNMLNQKPELAKAGIKPGQTMYGRELMVESEYIKQLPKKLQDDIRKFGCRFTHHTSIAPTGTISLSFGNNASSGVEPTFSHNYKRNVIKSEKKTKEQQEVNSLELLVFRDVTGNPDATPESMPESCITADEVSIEDHVLMQGCVQRWIDSSISKTINFPTDIERHAFENVYLLAAKHGLKGCTTYRFNPAVRGVVLVNEKDLENTVYRFELEDGSTITLKGNERVEYDGEIHVVANLYEALSNGTYGQH